MATGFVSRWKGKVHAAANGFFVQGQSQFGSLSAQTISTTNSTSFVTPTLSGRHVTIESSSFSYIYRLPTPDYVGKQITVLLSTNSALGVYFTASTAGTVFINGSTTQTTILSTQMTVFTLTATSTSNWAVSGIYPSTVGALTMSTST